MRSRYWILERPVFAGMVAALALLLVARPAAATRHRRAPVRRHQRPVEGIVSRCVYCGAIAVTAVVVNGGAIPVCVRHAADPDGDGTGEPPPPEPVPLPDHPLPDLPLPDPDLRSRPGPPPLPPADGILLPEDNPPSPALGNPPPRVHRAIRRRPRRS